MNKIAYVTLVTLVCYVAGKRTEIPPGKPVPEDLPETDIEALLASGSIERADAGEIEKRQQQLKAGQAQGDFAKERERILAERRANETAAKPVKGDDKGAQTGTGDQGGAGTGGDQGGSKDGKAAKADGAPKK